MTAGTKLSRARVSKRSGCLLFPRWQHGIFGLRNPSHPSPVVISAPKRKVMSVSVLVEK